MTLPIQSEPNHHRALGIWPGLCLAASIAAVAFALRQVPGLSMVNPMILAIVIGIGFHILSALPHEQNRELHSACARFRGLASFSSHAADGSASCLGRAPRHS